VGATGPLLYSHSHNDDYWEPLTDKELIYSGREGDVLHITYREYYQWRDYKTGLVSSYARTPFFQHVYYDLKTSHEIVFKDWVLQVLDANNQQIKFRVVKEPAKPGNPGN
jgi:hypothetical protein